MPLRIDLQAPTIPATTRVWRLFPGNGYLFLPHFIEQNAAFLDLPGFVLPDGPIATAPDLVDRLAFSQAVRAELYENGPDAEIDLNLGNFRGAKRTKARGRIRQAIINILSEAKTGDIIVVPSSLSDGRINIGRIVDDDIGEALFERKYGLYLLPSRNVRWLSNVDEGSISADLRKTLRHQHPFALIEKRHWVEILSLAFSSFIFVDRHVSTIFNENDFIDADASFLGNVTKLAAAACEALQNGDILDPNELLDLLLSSPPIEFTSSQQIDIHSPGFNRYVSGSIVSLVTAALVATFLALPPDAAQAQLAMQNVVVMNSSPDGDPQCSARVHEAQRVVLEMLGVDKTLKLCEAARRARDRGGLRSSATVKQ